MKFYKFAVASLAAMLLVLAAPLAAFGAVIYDGEADLKAQMSKKADYPGWDNKIQGGAGRLSYSGTPTYFWSKIYGLGITDRTHDYDGVDFVLGGLQPGRYALQVEFAAPEKEYFVFQEGDSPCDYLALGVGTGSILTYEFDIDEVGKSNGQNRIRLLTTSTRTFYIKSIKLTANNVKAPEPPANGADEPGPASEARGNSVGNNNQWAYVAGDDTWIYYTNASDNNYLYKMKKDGTGKIRLNKNETWDINVIGDWIYYANQDNGAVGNIYRMKTDGTKNEKLNKDESWFLNVVGDWIYYHNENDNGYIYKVKTDGTGKTRLNTHTSGDINVVDGWIYYSNLNDGRKIYKMTTTGAKNTRVSDAGGFCPNVVGDFIYYSNTNDYGRIYKIRVDGTGNTRITESAGSLLNVVGGYIYYVNNSDGSKIYKVSRTHGGDEKKLNDDASFCVNIVYDWVYYRNANDDFYRMKINGANKQQVK